MGENVYVPGHLTEISETVAATIEQVSGLDFDGTGYARESFPDGKVHLRVSRDFLYVGQDWYQGLATSETGNAFASAGTHVELSPGDLFWGSNYTTIHELSHMLMYRQSEWGHCQLLNEGFAEYTTYLALLELEQTDPAAAYYLSKSFYPIYNMCLYPEEYAELFRHPLEHWFENILECGNSNYTIGFRFMAYLQAVYGDYSKWIPAFENTYSFAKLHGYSDESAVSHQIQVLKDTYGQDVLDNFYPWLEANLHLFDDSACMTNTTDLTSVTQIGWYPIFNAVESVLKMEQVRYRDLYVDLEPAKQYLHEYKGLDISGLYLENPNNRTVICYQEDGSFSTPTNDSKIPLEGISYIKLAGEGEVISLQIKGFDQE